MSTPREPEGGYGRGRYDPDPYDPDPHDPDPYGADPPGSAYDRGPSARAGYDRDPDRAVPDGDPTWGRGPAGGWGAPADDRDRADPYGDGPHRDDSYRDDSYRDDRYGGESYGRDRYGDDPYDGGRYGADRHGADGYGADGYGADRYGSGYGDDRSAPAYDGRDGDVGYRATGYDRADEWDEPEPVEYAPRAGDAGASRYPSSRRGPRPAGRPVSRPPWILLGAVVLVVLAVLVLGFVTPGWFVTRVFDPEAVQTGVTKILTEDYAAGGVADVRCPTDVRVVAGATFTCDATVDGDPVKVPVRVTDGDGGYEVGRPT